MNLSVSDDTRDFIGRSGDFFFWTGVVMLMGSYAPDPAVNTAGWLGLILGGSALWAWGVMRHPMYHLMRSFNGGK